MERGAGSAQIPLTGVGAAQAWDAILQHDISSVAFWPSLIGTSAGASFGTSPGLRLRRHGASALHDAGE